MLKQRSELGVRTCSVEVDALRPVERWIDEGRGAWERRLDRLGDYLDGQAP